jgi:hypothetical protein
MNGPTDTEDTPNSGPHAADSDDERLLDHHLEELLAALGAGAPLGPEASPDASA